MRMEARSLKGADPGFFLGGGAPVRIGITDFFLLNTSCIRKPQVISGGGGGGEPPCTLPLDLPLLSVFFFGACYRYFICTV